MERLRRLHASRTASPPPAALPASSPEFLTPEAHGLGSGGIARDSPDANLTTGGESSRVSSFDIVSPPSGGGVGKLRLPIVLLLLMTMCPKRAVSRSPLHRFPQ